jgi:tetratricopeptide (TPR) repeat protein
VDELRMQTQVLSGRRVNAAGSVMPLEADRFRSGWQNLRARPTVERARPDPDVLAWHRQEAEACMAPREPSNFLTEPKDVSAAVWHLDRLLQADPAGVRARTLRGRAYAELGRWNEAVADYSQAIASGTTAAPWYDRGVAHIQLGKWDQAADDFARATQVANASPEAWSALALIHLHRRDEPGYRDACAGFLERQGKSTPWMFLGLSVARTCTAGPDALKDFQPVVQLVEKSSQWWYTTRDSATTVKAAVAYRAGQPAEAVRLLTETAAGKVAVAAQDYFFLALAQHQLGHPNEARQALARGVERLQQLQQERSKESPAAVLRSWQEQLEEQLVRREAERLLQGKMVVPKD